MSYRWAQYWANKYRWAIERRNDIDLEDLTQAAMMGQFIAESKYDDSKGKFSTFSAFFMRNEIRSLLGMRSGKLPPVTVSLDEPLTDADGEAGDDTRLDLLADTSLPDHDKDICADERRQEIRSAVDRLENDKQREAIKMCYFEGLGAKEIGERMGISQQDVYHLFADGRRAMRKDTALRNLHYNLDQKIPYYKHIGIEQFNRTRTSAVEYAVLVIEREHERILNLYG